MDATRCHFLLDAANQRQYITFRFIRPAATTAEATAWLSRCAAGPLLLATALAWRRQRWTCREHPPEQARDYCLRCAAYAHAPFTAEG